MNRTGLALNEYREKILLDTDFVKYTDSELENISSKDVLLEILDEIRKLTTIVYFAEKPSVKEMDDLLYRFIITRNPKPMHDKFLSKINLVLQKKLSKKKLTQTKDIPTAFHVNSKEIKLWRGDITTLVTDVIVNAANERLLGCFAPYHLCIDNVIHAQAGPQVRNDCFDIISIQGYPEPTGIAKITRAYNLPSKYILHTVGPIWDNHANLKKKEQLKQQLASSYISSLNLASKISDIKSISLCCISTGEFGFPQDVAAKIAFNTILDWCKASKQSHLNTIIFNTFLERDDLLYRELIKQYKMMNKTNGKN